MSLESCVLLLVRRYADHCLEPETQKVMRCRFGPGYIPSDRVISEDFPKIWSESPQFRKTARMTNHLWDYEVGPVTFDYGLHLSKEILKDTYTLSEAVESLRDAAERFVAQTVIRFILPVLQKRRENLVAALREELEK